MTKAQISKHLLMRSSELSQEQITKLMSYIENEIIINTVD